MCGWVVVEAVVVDMARESVAVVVAMMVAVLVVAIAVVQNVRADVVPRHDAVAMDSDNVVTLVVVMVPALAVVVVMERLVPEEMPAVVGSRSVMDLTRRLLMDRIVKAKVCSSQASPDLRLCCTNSRLRSVILMDM